MKSEISVKRRTDPATDEGVGELPPSMAPVFPGLYCIRLCKIAGGPIQAYPGDELRCTIDGNGRHAQVVEQIKRAMLIEYVAIYDIQQYGGTAAMFFERITLEKHES